MKPLEFLKNQDKKNKEKWKWVPLPGERIYCIGSDLSVYESAIPKSCHWWEDERIKYNNYFKTREEAKFKAEQIKVFNELKDFADENNDEIDWADGHQAKYFLLYDHENKKIVINANCIRINIGQIYFSNLEITRQAIEKIGEERIKKYLFGVEDNA